MNWNQDVQSKLFKMNQAESIELFFQEGSSDKVYQAELKQEGDGWVVNFAYGRRGNTLTTGCKTCDPLPYEKAKKSYDSLVKSKTAKGYKPNGVSGTINTVADDKEDLGIRPQLLNELTEKEAVAYINDSEYCMQEKYDGKRRGIEVTPNAGNPVIRGANKKGFEVALTNEVIGACAKIPFPQILDGEDMGDRIMIFDDIRAGELPYMDRYIIIKAHLKDNPILQVVETAWTTEEKREMYNRLKSERAEGVVFKNMNATYTPGRPASGGDQFKCKFYDEASCMVASVSDVKSSIGLSVLDASGEPVLVGNATVYPNSPKVEVGDIVEIKYLYYNEGGSLYQPVLKEVRDDVDADECTLAKLKRKKDE